MDALTVLRKRLDELDFTIASLLDERMGIADQIGKIKRDSHLTVTDQLRENEILETVKAIPQHPVLAENIVKIFTAIIETSKAAQTFYQFQRMPFKNIGIIGLGLIGGSICKGMKMKNPAVEIATIFHPSEDYRQALEEGLIDHSFSSVTELCQHVDLIILASPISTIASYAQEIKQTASLERKLLVIDVASVKTEIVRAFEVLTAENVEFLGTHPMAGKENGGLPNAKGTMFINRPWILTPHAKNSSQAIENITALIHFLGGTPFCLDAAKHDRQAALISHVPNRIARKYVDFVTLADKESLNIAGPGFHSFTRLAHDNASMHAEISQINRHAIEDYLDCWASYFGKKIGKQI